MTHPFHPLFGQEFDFVLRGLNWHHDRAVFRDGADHLHSIPAAWTDLVTEDPSNVVAAGRASFRTQELLDLVCLLNAFHP
ncbi:DUF5372 family protein [Azohydromonas australica]|uniref:DUF5372 family protein n=1 Tax=Azohydromonas australica TaxID=364039 RepID=UPI000402A361|nr:DUF5372 family protein [Azohydromonas australica]